MKKILQSVYGNHLQNPTIFSGYLISFVLIFSTKFNLVLNTDLNLLCNQGVDDINIDLRQHKVVVTGNVDSYTLIKRLTKAGKHAELWPEKAESKKKKEKPAENREKQSDPESREETTQSGEHHEETVKVVDASKNVEAATTAGNAAKNNDGCGGVNVSKANEGGVTGKPGVQFQEPKAAEVRQTVVLPAGPVTGKKVSVAVQVPQEIEAPGNEQIGGGGGGGSTGEKKKKKKGKAKVNSNNGNEGVAAVTAEHPGGGEAAATGGSGNRSKGQGHVHVPGPTTSVPISRPANESPPHHHMYPPDNVSAPRHHMYPPHYYAPPQPAPVYTMSYHTTHPSSSSGYGAAYYAPPQPYSYAHVVHPGNEMEPPPYTYESESYASSQPSESFEYFSDENPNACSVM